VSSVPLWLSQSPILGDGAMGTMLQAAGLPLGDIPERWNLERPTEVIRVHAAFAAAGAQWVQTNTFGANRGRLEQAGLADQLLRINAEGVRCARLGAPHVPILGSIGPAGLKEPNICHAVYSEQVEALVSAGVDGFMVETITTLQEGRTAVRAAAAAGVGPVMASFTPGPEGALLDGTLPETAAEVLFAAGAAVIGVNCGHGAESLVAPGRRLVNMGLGPVLTGPNAGLPVVEAGQAVYPLSPDAFARAAVRLHQIGAGLIAGCCGTTPEHIRAAAMALSGSSL
jgi:5-methyltetrahydrofolate--homocysteine methyltransferase